MVSNFQRGGCEACRGSDYGFVMVVSDVLLCGVPVLGAANHPSVGMLAKMSLGLILLNFGEWQRLIRGELGSPCCLISQFRLLATSLSLSWVLSELSCCL